MTTTDRGSFIWYELMTADPDAAKRFYDAVVGWDIGVAPPGDSGFDYRMIARADGGHNGGVLHLSDEMIAGGARPTWIGYVHVPDIDAAVAQLGDAGGRVVDDRIVDGVGRMALFADPYGAMIYVMTPTPPADAPNARSDVFSVDRAQHVRWNELITPDADAAVAFYTSLFGWTQDHAMPMGELGDYRFITLGTTDIGAIMPQADFMPHAGWTHYIGVDDIDRAVAAVRAGGGEVMGEPQAIPGGEYSIHARDPEGVYFGLVGPRHG